MTIQTKKKYNGQQTTDVLTGKLRIEDGNNRLIMNDGTVSRLIIGQAPNGEYVVAITIEGIDVITALEQ